MKVGRIVLMGKVFQKKGPMNLETRQSQLQEDDQIMVKYSRILVMTELSRVMYDWKELKSKVV